MKAENGSPLGIWKSTLEAVSFPESRNPVWTNNHTSIDLRDRLLELIESAKRTLWVASPFIDDSRIIAAIVRARNRRVRVKVITDIRNNRGRGKMYQTRGFEAKSEEASLPQKHHACIRDLARSSVACRSPTHYPHFKLMISDDQNALISSANLTQNSLGGNGGSSLEVGISIDRNDHVTQLSSLLSSLWRSCPFRLIVNSNDVSIEQRGRGESIASVANHASKHGLLANSPGEKVFLLTEAILEGIDTAERDILIATMSFFESNKVPRLEESLLAALSRGVSVTTIVRPEHFRRDEQLGHYPDPSTKRLIDSGMRLQGITGLHAKGMLIDEEEGLVFSANINPYSLTGELESHHMELGLRVGKEDHCFNELSSFMDELRLAATQEFVSC